MGLVFSTAPGPGSSSSATADIHFNRGYLTTLSGGLKILEITLSLVAFILAFSGYDWAAYSIGSARWTKFAACTAFVSSFLRLIMSLFGLYSWVLYEMIFDFVRAVFLLIAGAVMIPNAERDTTRAACVAFCWAATVVYLVDGLLKVRLRRSATTITTTNGTGVLTTHQQVIKV